MNEKDLWAYKEALKRKKRAAEKLEEFETKIYSAASQRFSAEMRSDSADNDKYSAIVDKHDELLLRLYKATNEAAAAFNRLEEVETVLSEGESDLLHFRYRLGYSWRDIERELHISHEGAKFRRKNILEKIKKLPITTP